MTYKSTSIILFFLTFFVYGHASQPIVVEFSLVVDQAQQDDQLAQIPPSFYVEASSVTADVPVNYNEIKYLFNIKKNNILTREDISLGLKFIENKNKFERVVLTFTQRSIGYDVEIELVGHWTFYQVKMHGFLLNKDRFGSYYLLEPGQKFDLEKHQKSIERIKNIFKEDGYFNADIRENLVFDEKAKTVVVHLTIDRRTMFRINEIELSAKAALGVGEVEIRELKKKLIRRLKSGLLNVYYNKSLIDQEVKELRGYLRKKGYLRSGLKVIEKVERANNAVMLSFSLTVHKKKKFVFLGNHFFSSIQMLEKVSLFGKAAAHIPSSIIAAEIEDAYKKSGFLGVRVHAEEEEDKFVFIITEGPRAYLNKFIIEGADTFNQNEIDKVVLSDFYKNYAEADTLRKIEDGVMQFYRQKGFWDASVNVSYFKDMDDGAYVMRVKIFEGRQRFISSVEVPNFSELESFPAFSLTKKLDAPFPFDNSILEQQRQLLTQHLQRQGCLYAHVKPEFIERDNVLDVRWHAVGDTRPVAFGKTVIIGNSSLPYEKIMRELEYKDGMAWDRDKIAKSLDNLRKLSIFDSVSLYPSNNDRNHDSKSLVLQVIDGSPFEARIRIGYQHVNIVRGSTYKVGGSMLLKNPTNRADLIRFDADMTRFYRSASLNYELPWIFGQPIKTVVRGYLETYDQPLFWGSREFLYRSDHDGFCVKFLRGFSCGDVGLAVGCDWLSTRDLSPGLARAINFIPDLVGKKFGFIFFEPHFLIDLLDNTLNPTWGALTNFSLRAALSFSKNNLSFVKALFEQSFFFPLTQKTVGAIRCRFGNIFHSDFSTLIPPERFYLGGPYSLRGFEPNMAPPLGRFELNEIIYVPVGGKTMFNINLEVRAPISGDLGIVVFQDVGALIARKVPSISSDDLGSASGFGLRYATPMGPIRFDLGMKWKKRFEDDSRIAWFLTFGHAF